MAKIPRIAKTSYADILKQRKLEQIKVAKEKAEAIRIEKELQFDQFVKNTAKDIVKDIFRCQVQVITAPKWTKSL